MVQDLKDFLAKVKEDKALQDRMDAIIKESTPENSFERCNAVAKEMGYNITEEDMQSYVDTVLPDLNDAELDKVTGGSTPACVSISVVVTINVGMSIYSAVEKD